ncbi:hypothetical protein PPERSA_07481 [Pseudocohnilembus persalinus]|uniref:B box-type domain-containing protein n=1 Tax=Pseudocohnilembus persalinus TaxID=266149 RepID=A0A0V0R2P0_PSEPJ|nr:hypothetical protein PPERSA_07481 [Pseudocohnilembus persalinus]|eukprot:KRX08669.1 hypothetical protein PPERSA_07481 [Pseudocohnilembus persalinus]
MKCRQHDDFLSLYCVKHKETLCVQCVYDDHSHRKTGSKCEITSLKNSEQLIKEDIEIFRKFMLQKQEEIQKIQQSLLFNMQTFDISLKKQQNYLIGYFQGFIHQLGKTNE